MLVALHRALPAAALALCVLARAAAAPEDASQGDSKAADAAGKPAVCLEAVVNPVSGHAECVNPRGAPVQPPPPRPQPQSPAGDPVGDGPLRDGNDRH